MCYEDFYLKKVQSLNVYRHGERRAPHKPLLLLFAIAELIRGNHIIPFSKVETALGPLLNAYAPPVKSRHQPELPYWHLQSDKIWEIDGATGFQMQGGNFPAMGSLRPSCGHLESGFASRLTSDSGFLREVVEILLFGHFPESLHGGILANVGLELPEPGLVADRPEDSQSRRRRDPNFRNDVLRAYDYKCAVSGFQVAIGGSLFGCEAAHVMWHARGGPDDIRNGIAVEPTLHTLFDAGAWTLTDDRKILVSATLTGEDESIRRIRGFHGRPLRDPADHSNRLSEDFIQWHREIDRGGVFRHPAMRLA